MTTSQAQPPQTVGEFTQTFPATRLGASFARRVAVALLDGWGVPPGSPLSDTVALLVAELAANAVRHGRVPGRNFELRLLQDRTHHRTHDQAHEETHEQAHACPVTAVRVEVSDTHPRRPDPTAVTMAGPDSDGGRGLALVAALADDWGVADRTGPGKTVWARTATTGHPDPSGPARA